MSFHFYMLEYASLKNMDIFLYDQNASDSHSKVGGSWCHSVLSLESSLPVISNMSLNHWCGSQPKQDPHTASGSSTLCSLYSRAAPPFPHLPQKPGQPPAGPFRVMVLSVCFSAEPSFMFLSSLYFLRVGVTHLNSHL